MFEHRKEVFFLRIILPTFLAIFFFVVTIFAVLLPQFEEIILDRKKEMIKELAHTAISVLVEQHKKEKLGEITKTEAQNRAIEEIRNLRYGKENKDYFWITDMHPRMIMHPYREDLNGKELKSYTDEKGRRPFELFRQKVQSRGAGYVEYSWQWKDDSRKILPKLSFVEGFREWGWIVGTGVYIDDVRNEIGRITRDIIWISFIIIVIIGAILAYVIHQMFKLEKTRESTFRWFKKTQERYRALAVSSKVEEKKPIGKNAIYYNNVFVSKQKVNEFVMPVVKCDLSARIKQAIFLMKESKVDVLVLSAGERDVGMITSHDLFTRVLSEDFDQNRSVSEVMTSPIVTIREDALIYEAVELMQRNEVRKLFVRDQNEQIVGVIHSSTLLAAVQLNLNTIMSSIKNSTCLEEVKRHYLLVKKSVAPYLESGLAASEITKIISKISDLITTKIILFVEQNIGQAPVSYAFITLGSEGRDEQTLFSDQDNALIYDDRDGKPTKETIEYFKKFSNQVCSALHEVGQEFCRAEIMASNPKWCQSLSLWKDYFVRWSRLNDPKDLFDASIFYDFRIIYGDFTLTNLLRDKMFENLRDNDIFFLNLGEVSREWTSPISMLGHFITEGEGIPPNTIDIKAMIKPLVNYVRFYALKLGIHETNTLRRLQHLYEMKALSEQFFREFCDVYDFLMKTRLRHQAWQLSCNFEINNYVNLDQLTKLDKETLKHCASFINQTLGKLERKA